MTRLGKIFDDRLDQVEESLDLAKSTRELCRVIDHQQMVDHLAYDCYMAGLISEADMHQLQGRLQHITQGWAHAEVTDHAEI
jgi:hypothetical protein